MLYSEYKKHTRKFFLGRKVKLLREIRNCSGQYALAGTICEITDKFGGFGLKVPPCSHGLGLYISKVAPCDVELLDDA